MSLAYPVGLLYIAFGAVLLYFGIRFLKVTVGLLGGLIGINIGQILVSWWGLHDFWAFGLILLCAIVVGLAAVMFYSWFVAGAMGYLLGILAYNLALNWSASHTWAVIIGILAAVATFVIVWRFDAVEVIFKFVTSAFGAMALTAGLYVMFHTDKLQTLQTNYFDVLLGASIWWILLWLIAFGSGFAFQMSALVKPEALKPTLA